MYVAYINLTRLQKSNSLNMAQPTGQRGHIQENSENENLFFPP